MKWGKGVRAWVRESINVRMWIKMTIVIFYWAKIIWLLFFRVTKWITHLLFTFPLSYLPFPKPWKHTHDCNCLAGKKKKTQNKRITQTFLSFLFFEKRVNWSRAFFLPSLDKITISSISYLRFFLFKKKWRRTTQKCASLFVDLNLKNICKKSIIIWLKNNLFLL